MDKKNLYGVIFDDKAQEVYSEVYGGGSGGTIVVDELPETGEEHTIYELRETSKGSYNWVAMLTRQMEEDGVTKLDYEYFIFDSYEELDEMAHTYYTWDNGGTDLNPALCYVRTNDTLYKVHCDVELQTIINQLTKISDYKFKVDNTHTCCILKEYIGEERPFAEDGYQYSAKLLNDEIVWLDTEKFTIGFILHQAEIDEMEYSISWGKINPHPVAQLPTAEEAVANYLDDLIANNGFIAVEIDGVIKGNSSDNGIYHWEGKPAIPETIYNFWTYVEQGDEPVYTGPLEWMDIPSEIIYTEIPYNKILSTSYDLNHWIFKPQKAGEIITSYWIYANGEWLNIDEVEKVLNTLIVRGFVYGYEEGYFNNLTINGERVTLPDTAYNYLNEVYCFLTDKYLPLNTPITISIRQMGSIIDLTVIINGKEPLPTTKEGGYITATFTLTGQSMVSIQPLEGE